MFVQGTRSFSAEPILFDVVVENTDLETRGVLILLNQQKFAIFSVSTLSGGAYIYDEDSNQS